MPDGIESASTNRLTNEELTDAQMRGTSLDHFILLNMHVYDGRRGMKFV